nr:unnamed protein product [Callosobruchus analis]
MGQNYREL